MTVTDPEEPLIHSILETLQRARIHHSCVTCSNFDEPKEICTMFQQRPPARVIAEGCRHYEEIPPF